MEDFPTTSDVVKYWIEDSSKHFIEAINAAGDEFGIDVSDKILDIVKIRKSVLQEIEENND